MSNPQAIQVHCDGAMDYDTNQTGGNGFEIAFPDVFELEPVTKSIRNDGQGIHRLEMISIIESMEELLSILKENPELARGSAGVEIYTDRFSVTDGELIGPYRIRDWRKNKWRTHEGKPVKNSDLLDRIDKTRLKLSKAVGGLVTVTFKRRTQNKVADKLARAGKLTATRGKRLIEKNKRRVIKRIYDGDEVDYSRVSSDAIIEVRVYAWMPVNNDYEICFESCSGDFEGHIIKTYVTQELKDQLQRGHFYMINIAEVFKHHIRIELLEVDTRK